IYPYRFDAQERAIRGGMRGVGFSALLGLAKDFRKDAYATGLHAWYLQRKYPHAEISLSCPRLRPVAGQEYIDYNTVSDKHLFQVLCAYRIFMPFAGIVVSTRENKQFRDKAMQVCTTKISAGVSTGIGTHSSEIKDEDEGDSQFDIADHRSLDDVCSDLRAEGMQPVLNDYVYVG
ncbi:MAG: 2-iminoacetate synthase ThiH, partial [Coriobacteriales bacterium]